MDAAALLKSSLAACFLALTVSSAVTAVQREQLVTSHTPAMPTQNTRS